MIFNGLMLGGLTAYGFWFLWSKLPAWLTFWFLDGPQYRHLLLDGIAAGLTYMLFFGSVTGLFAAAFVAIIVSVMLKLRGNGHVMDTWSKFTAFVESFSGRPVKPRASSTHNDTSYWAPVKGTPKKRWWAFWRKDDGPHLEVVS